MNPEAIEQLKRDLGAWLQGVIDITDSLAAHAPSRELSLVKTNAEQAQMWFERTT